MNRMSEQHGEPDEPMLMCLLLRAQMAGDAERKRHILDAIKDRGFCNLTALAALKTLTDSIPPEGMRQSELEARLEEIERDIRRSHRAQPNN